MVQGFSVDPERLRASATAVDGVRADAGVLAETCAADAGHAGVGSALSGFAGRAGAVWAGHVQALADTVERLRATADLYERADQESAIRDEGGVR